ncbi:MAG: DinB family protein [Calditrichaeota bacterium]|nr:MAG: DinB family protein [Calditrichota bacterium]
MDLTYFVDKMRQNAKTIETAFSCLTEEEIYWHPQPEKWSLLDIICHLYDEEHLDFRVRIDYTLFRPREQWPAIDPEGWVTAHNYAEKSLEIMLKNFLEEREKSIVWLEKLQQADWHCAHVHPQFGEIKAGDLLSAWLAHDYLHLRQIMNTKLSYLRAKALPYSLRYAE